MQQTRNKRRLVLNGCGLALSLLAPAPFARAQDTGTQTDAKTQAAGRATTPPAASQKPAGDTAQAGEPAGELPLLLLVVQRPVGTPARRDDVNASLSLMLRSSLRESRKFQVVLYSAEQPSIRRALLEHSIAATELVEPIKTEPLQKLAHLIGARYVLMVSSEMDKASLKTDVRLLEDMGLDGSPESWITPHAEPVTIDAQMGKLRLKPDQMLALAVDKIDTFLGIPSHLADNIHLTRTRTIGKPTVEVAKNDSRDKSGKNATSNSTPGDKISDRTDADKTAQSGDAVRDGGAAAMGRGTASQGRTGQGSQNGAAQTARGNGDTGATGKNTAAIKSSGSGNGGTDAETGADTKPSRIADADVKKTDAKKADAKKAEKKPSPPRIARAPAKPSRDVQIAKKEGPHSDDITETSGRSIIGTTPAERSMDNPDNALTREGRASRNDAPARALSANARQPAMLATDTGAILLADPRVVPPTPPGDKPNYEQAADRYRRTGDLSNSIESLRQAINDNPADVHLRKKLIVAYQDKQLLDQAVNETERAMQMAPTDPDLSRLYANSLTARGDTAGAIKLLRDIVTAAPGNTTAQVALGDALMSDSQYADALTAFETAARSDPKSPLPHRRLARVFAARAGSDTAQYAACLQQIAQARALTPATDTQTYQGDYFEIMLLLESRLKDMLDQTNETLGGGGRRSASDLMRVANDLKERTGAASDFLDKMPPAAGQDITHAHYQQAAALLAQSVGYLRKYLQNNDVQAGSSLSGTRADALAELATAHNRLTTSRAALEKGRAVFGASGTGN